MIKTFMIIAVVLVMINVPVFYLLKESQYFSLAGLKYEVEVETVGDVKLACPTDNHYFIGLNHFGMKAKRRLENAVDQTD